MTKNFDEKFLDLSVLFLLIAPCLIIVHIFFLIMIFNTEISYFYGLDYLFHLDGEYNIPALFSTAILAYSAVLLLKIYSLTRLEKPEKYWAILAIIFFYLATDELISIHEGFILPLRQIFDLQGYFYFSWVIVGIFFALTVFISSLPFLRRLSPGLCKQFIIAGFIYILGAIGMEMIGANEAYSSGYVYGWQNTEDRGITYAIIVTIEETLEIFGILYFNYVLVKYIKTLKPPQQ